MYAVENDTRKTGFLAQHVEQLVSELEIDFGGVDIPQSPSGTYGLRYAEFVVPLVKATQEQQDKIVQLEAENIQLRERLDQLEAIVLQLAER